MIGSGTSSGHVGAGPRCHTWVTPHVPEFLDPRTALLLPPEMHQLQGEGGVPWGECVCWGGRGSWGGPLGEIMYVHIVCVCVCMMCVWGKSGASGRAVCSCYMCVMRVFVCLLRCACWEPGESPPLPPATSQEPPRVVPAPTRTTICRLAWSPGERVGSWNGG